MINQKTPLEDGRTSKETPQYSELSYLVSRQCLHQEAFNQLSQYERLKPTAIDSIGSSVRDFRCISTLKAFFPIIQWLPKYSLKHDLFSDMTAGLTVAVLQIPQGMAYGILAGVAANVGLYMAFFHSLVYAVMGTSRHISMGTFAVTSLMTAKIVATYATFVPTLALNETVGAIDPAIDPIAEAVYTPIQVATAVSFVAGIIYFAMSAARLGMLSSLLSEPLVSGFTTAAAVHVMVSQLKDLLGVSIPRYKGAFKVILSLRDIFDQVPNANLTAVYTSLVVIFFMIFMNEYLKPWLSTKCRFPVPAELMAVVGGTVVSYLIRLGPDFGVGLVGSIPTGLPAPQFPPLALIKAVAVDSIAVTIVGYSIVMSMGMIFAQKDNYEVRPNQELVALGVTNVIGSMFSCIPTACSLSRSLIQHQTGGKTQIAAVFSSMIMLVVLLWVGPYFESLPRCVLAAIIVVALKGMLIQVYHIKKFQREGSLELFVWCVTFLSVVIIDIDVGLLIGAAFSLLALYVKGWRTYYSVLGTVPDTAIYVDIGSHQRAEELPHIKIFKFTGAINFANKTNFKKALYKKTKILQRYNPSLIPRYNGESTSLESTKTVIIDLSSVPHVDTAACKMLTEVKQQLEKINVDLLLATPADCVYDALLHAESIGEGGFLIFPTIHDAVIHAQGEISAV
ncbi:sulfate transporter [Anopheles ziemanni]|uniref:sulfate transporter n=1 Tax=Anopheles coustani TaxID=139045 RepID=UPI002658B2A0|nr:sulfate transporter [Anopheles coustani]XP_058176906.1 sulfate transporter [Anopheles ziemanni]